MRSDNIENNAIDNSQSTDLYDSISEIEVSLKYGDTSNPRKDTFAACLDDVFGITLDDIDNIETLICDKAPDVREVYEEMYNIFRDGLLTFYDRHLGVKFNYDDINRKPDFNEIYSVYKVMYLGEYDLLGKLFAYIILKNPGVYDLRKNTCFTDILFDTAVFNLDNIPKILNKTDPGNIDNIVVFGEDIEDDDMYNAKISIDMDVWRSHIIKVLNLGAGVLNRDILREKVITYMDYINENKLL